MFYYLGIIFYWGIIRLNGALPDGYYRFIYTINGAVVWRHLVDVFCNNSIIFFVARTFWLLFYLFVLFSIGIDVTANQDEISDHETFQLEYDTSTGRWYIRTMGDRYWTLETAGGIQASSARKYIFFKIYKKIYIYLLMRSKYLMNFYWHIMYL